MRSDMQITLTETSLNPSVNPAPGIRVRDAPGTKGVSLLPTAPHRHHRAQPIHTDCENQTRSRLEMENHIHNQTSVRIRVDPW